MAPADVSNLIAGLALVVSVGVFARGEVARRAGLRSARKADEAAERATSAAEASAQAAKDSLRLENRATAALEKMADQWGEFMSRQEKRDQRQWSARPSAGQGPTGYETRGGGGPWAGLPPSVRPPQSAVHWTVDKIKGRTHMLRNLGRATAYGVELRSDNAVRFSGPEALDLEMGEAVEFFAAGSWQTGTPELVVSWTDAPDGERREWRRPIP